MNEFTKTKRILAIAAVILVAATMASARNNDKVASDLDSQDRDDQGRIRVIVRHDAEFGDRDLRGLRRHGARMHRTLDGIQAFAGSLTDDQIDELSYDARILSISPDRRVIGNLATAVATLGSALPRRPTGYAWLGLSRYAHHWRPSRPRLSSG